MTSAAQRRAGADKGAEKSAEKSAHRAADKVPVYQVLAEDIKAMGVEAVFGLMSDDTALFATALDTSGVRFYGARHENTAIAMADGYAYATGRLGVAVVGRGPALANGLHAAVYASRTGSSLLVIYGEAATGAQPNGLGPDYKAFDGVGVLRAAGLRTFSATSPQSVRAVLADAAATAMAGGSVSLHLPTNVQLAEIERPAEALSIKRPERTPAPAKPQSIAAAAAVLAKASRPLIVAGMGAHRAGARKAIEQLADKTGALIVTTARGKTCSAAIPMRWASSARSRIRLPAAWRTRPTACWCSARASTSSRPASAPRCRRCR